MTASNTVELRYAKEDDFGDVDADADSYQKLRFNSESLASTVNTEDAAEISPERNITDTIPLGASNGGDITTSFSYKNLDAFIESAMYSTFTKISAAGDAIAIAESTGVTTGTRPDAEVGDWYYVGGASTVKSRGWYRVVTVASDKASVVVPGPSSGNGVAAGTIGADTARIKNGKTRQPLSIEKFFSGLDTTDSGGKDFHYYLGCVVNTLTLEFRAGATVGATVGLTALSHEASAATKFTATAGAAEAGTIYSPEDTKLFGAVSGTTSYLGKDPIITAITLSINNNVRETEELGTLDTPDIIPGSFGCSGTVEMYFKDSDLYDRFLGRNDTALAWAVYEKNKPQNGYGFYMPKVRFNNARVQATGNDADLIASFDYRALGTAGTTPYTLKIMRGA